MLFVRRDSAKSCFLCGKIMRKWRDSALDSAILVRFCVFCAFCAVRFCDFCAFCRILPQNSKIAESAV
ncbi:hypothetical protein [Helicobacter sp. 23-1045]